ncbi:hypothetical protein BaRGS_00019991 [Batillaria attramentaria]|uniref:Uncharacterized protein n=1 Tax=Batillaria attramentaria TaxID=370345 RepID=A0ABD0KNR7_9CAEN
MRGPSSEHGNLCPRVLRDFEDVYHIYGKGTKPPINSMALRPVFRLMLDFLHSCNPVTLKTCFIPRNSYTSLPDIAGPQALPCCDPTHRLQPPRATMSGRPGDKKGRDRVAMEKGAVLSLATNPTDFSSMLSVFVCWPLDEIPERSSPLTNGGIDFRCLRYLGWVTLHGKQRLFPLG